MIGYDKNTCDTALGITVSGHALLNKIRCGLYNATNGKIDVGGIAISSRDTEFAYLLSANGKLTKAQLLFARTLAQGIAIGSQLESAFHLENDNSF